MRDCRDFLIITVHRLAGKEVVLRDRSPLIKMILQYGTNALGTALKLVLCLQFSFFFFRFFFITVILISKNIWYM